MRSWGSTWGSRTQGHVSEPMQINIHNTRTTTVSFFFHSFILIVIIIMYIAKSVVCERESSCTYGVDTTHGRKRLKYRSKRPSKNSVTAAISSSAHTETYTEKPHHSPRRQYFRTSLPLSLPLFLSLLSQCREFHTPFPHLFDLPEPQNP